MVWSVTSKTSVYGIPSFPVRGAKGSGAEHSIKQFAKNHLQDGLVLHESYSLLCGCSGLSVLHVQGTFSCFVDVLKPATASVNNWIFCAGGQPPRSQWHDSRGTTTFALDFDCLLIS